MNLIQTRCQNHINEKKDGLLISLSSIKLMTNIKILAFREWCDSVFT